MTEPSAAEPGLLERPDAGRKAIRGGALRSGGYVVGMALALASAPLLTRYLGVVDFGRYVAVLSLVTVVQLIADAGLTIVGVREYAIRDPAERPRLMGNLATLRLLIGVVGVLGAVAFAAVAGYGSVMVGGTALAGAGVVLALMQHTYTVPLSADLRLGTATVLDLLRQFLTVAMIVVLVIVGASLTAFYALTIPVGILVLALTLALVRRQVSVTPRFDRADIAYLVRETIPAAASSLLASLFYRVAIVVLPLVVTARELGYFSASFRFIEAIVSIPGLITGAAFPILAHAAKSNRERLRYVLERLFEVMLLIGTWIALCAALGAGVAIDVIAGDEFAPAAPVLRVQGVAVVASFLIPVWAAALWVIDARRPLVISGLIGVGSAAALSIVFGSLWGAIGAGVAMTVAETIFAVALAYTLMRPNPDLRPSLRIVPKVAVATALAAATALLPVPEAVTVAIATVVFAGTLVALRAIPQEVWDSLPFRGRFGGRSGRPPAA